jgi:hypothetical protein
MMLKEEKHTAHAVAFAIELPSHQGQEPQIKKRLEADAAASAPSITLDKIKEKLQRAEQNRKQTLEFSNQYQQKDRQRSKQVNERKASIDQDKENTLKKVDTINKQADEKRSTFIEQKKQKAQKHLEKVDQVRKLKQQQREQETTDQKKQLDTKLDHAA